MEEGRGGVEIDTNISETTKQNKKQKPDHTRGTNGWKSNNISIITTSKDLTDNA